MDLAYNQAGATVLSARYVATAPLDEFPLEHWPGSLMFDICTWH